MRRSVLILLYCLFAGTAFAQLQDNVLLKRMLTGIYTRDQHLRQLLNQSNLSAHAADSIWKLQLVIDSVNLVAIEKIMTERGYPGKTMVGEQESTIAWNVIQHSEKIKNYFPVIKRAGENGELTKDLVAMMEDRLLMEDGKPQVYGTQGAGVMTKDAPTGTAKTIIYIWPVADAEHVNERRYAAGFEDGILEYAKQLHAVFDKTLTIERLQQMRK